MGGAGGNDFHPRHRKETRMFNRPARIENPQRPDKLLAWFAARSISATLPEMSPMVGLIWALVMRNMVAPSSGEFGLLCEHLAQVGQEGLVITQSLAR